ncbi:MAG: recombinase family protein [Planctomycetes bacterium]|nr:recombinase family protein [Planctomycetota bacterium]
MPRGSDRQSWQEQLSFAQYEREIIAERTRDKVRAARRKGKWTGGWPPLGYDVAPEGGRLVVNKPEAGQVRSLFRLYLERRSVPAVAREANRRGWTTKSWTTREGKRRPGKPFTKNFMYKLLRNRLYAGSISLGNETYKGEHEAIIDKATWDNVQALLGENGSTGGAKVRNMHGALLKGIIYCGSCGSPITHVHTKKRNRVYRYYVCRKAQKEGWKTCPTKSVSAPDIEQFVLDRVKAMGEDPALKAEVVARLRAKKASGLASLTNERSLIDSQVRRRRDEIRRLVASLAQDDSPASAIATRLGELERENSTAAARLAELDKEISAHHSSEVDQSTVTKALEAFDPIWDELFPLERVRILQLVIKRVTYDGEAGTVSLDLHETGIRALAEEMRAAEAEANGEKEE